VLNFKETEMIMTKFDGFSKFDKNDPFAEIVVCICKEKFFNARVT